ncbi:MAG: hypothetical protein SWZ49_19715 [Cyanobacteriota bacterium]|nr:hypothetical protein [Cyanobacteriota bacterium]
MSKIRIHELSFCEKEDSELQNISGGDSSLLKYYNSFFLGTHSTADFTPTDALSTDLLTDTVEETVVSEDGSFGQARVVKGTTGGRQFVRSTARARV